MPFSRYSRTPLIKGGTKIGTNRSALAIRRSVELGNITYTTYTAKEDERLDTISGRFYGNAKYWWVIAAASGIGWGLQVPPGTRLVIPEDLSVIEQMVG